MPFEKSIDQIPKTLPIPFPGMSQQRLRYTGLDRHRQFTTFSQDERCHLCLPQLQDGEPAPSIPPVARQAAPAVENDEITFDGTPSELEDAYRWRIQIVGGAEIANLPMSNNAVTAGPVFEASPNQVTIKIDAQQVLSDHCPGKPVASFTHTVEPQAGDNALLHLDASDSTEIETESATYAWYASGGDLSQVIPIGMGPTTQVNFEYGAELIAASGGLIVMLEITQPNGVAIASDFIPLIQP